MTYIDKDGVVQEEGLFGGYHDKQGIFGQVADTNIFGQPNVERNILGMPVPATNALGFPIRNDEGEPLYKSSSGGGGGGGGGEAMIVLGILLLAFILVVAAVMAAYYILKGVGIVLAACYQGWRDLVRRYPRAMLVVHLVLGAGGAYGALAAAGFAVPICAVGAALVPALWGWLWLTHRLPLVLMPINAVLFGGALWYGSTLTRDAWAPVWLPLTAGLPGLGNLPVVLAILPLVAWGWSLAMRRWPNVFIVPNRLAIGVALWFLLMRAWVPWQPYWAEWTTPAAFVPPVGLLLLLAPLGAWLWQRGHEIWPHPFIALDLLLAGEILGLSAYHVLPVWDSAWGHWAGDLPIAAAPITALSVAPVSLWGWTQVSLRQPRWLIVPNLILSGAVAWLVLDRLRPLWQESWRVLWGDVPLRPDPVAIVPILPLLAWGWRSGSRHWPAWWRPLWMLLLGVIAWWIIERLRPFWHQVWLDFAGARAINIALVVGLLPLFAWGWWQAHQRWPRPLAIGSEIVAILLLGWTIGRALPEAHPLFVAALALVPLAAWWWGQFLRRRPRLGWVLTLFPWLAVGGLALLAQDRAWATLALLVDWLIAQGIPLTPLPH